MAVVVTEIIVIIILFLVELIKVRTVQLGITRMGPMMVGL